MVKLNFSTLLSQLFACKKKQTIRKPRKIIRKDGIPPILIGTQLNIYASIKVGNARVIKITRKTLGEITEEEAIRDGFTTKEECIAKLKELHSNKEIDSYSEFDIIEFKPEWEPFYIIDKQTLEQLMYLSRERDLILKEKDLSKYKDKEYELQQLLHKIKSLQLTVLEE